MWEARLQTLPFVTLSMTNLIVCITVYFHNYVVVVEIIHISVEYRSQCSDLHNLLLSVVKHRTI